MRKLINNIGLIFTLILFTTLLTNFKEKIGSDNYNYQKDADSKIEGLYILKSCENSRFKISIDKTVDSYMYFILDGKKKISKGKVFIKKEENETIIAFGEIVGIYRRNDILIQNHGDAMNHYMHFTQCGDKFLIFEKQ